MNRYQNNSYGLVGNGLLANHISSYFNLENISHIRWIRKEDAIPPEKKLIKCNIILLAISDDSIEDFITKNPFLNTKTVIHFSGALNTEKATGIHPLMTFSNKKYLLEEYRKIPFIGDVNLDLFRSYFPSLKNNYYQIDKNLKPLYHSLCVLGGNFTTMLWQKVFNDFNNELNLPKEVLFPYLDKVVDNIKTDHLNALTGPVKRQDSSTIKKNIKALKKPLWKRLYKIFNKIYKEDYR